MDHEQLKRALATQYGGGLPRRVVFGKPLMDQAVVCSELAAMIARVETAQEDPSNPTRHGTSAPLTFAI